MHNFSNYVNCLSIYQKRIEQKILYIPIKQTGKDGQRLLNDREFKQYTYL